MILKYAKVFADVTKLTGYPNLSSHALDAYLPPYTQEQFLEISAKVLPKLKIAHVIGKTVWHQGGDFRDAISIGKLIRKNDGPEDVERMLSTMRKYDQNNNSTSGSGQKN